MAKWVHSTSIILQHVTAPLSTRSRHRILFTAAITVVVGGITAVTAANIANLVRMPPPDTDLIQLCGQFVALEKASCAICHELKPIVDNKAWAV